MYSAMHHWQLFYVGLTPTTAGNCKSNALVFGRCTGLVSQHVSGVGVACVGAPSLHQIAPSMYVECVVF